MYFICALSVLLSKSIKDNTRKGIVEAAASLIYLSCYKRVLLNFYILFFFLIKIQ